ncbi:MAG: hypothetical protein ACYC61_27740 [Isosphaeraceae bacterium]
MTYDRCQAILEELRRMQGTDRPMIRVVAGTLVVRGRVMHDPWGRRNPASPFGVLIVEQPGLAPGPASLVQIASIPEDGLSGLDAP